MSKRVIKASTLVVGGAPITISAPWSVAGWDEAAVAAAEEGTDLEAEAAHQEDQEEEAREAPDRERAEAAVAEAAAEAGRILEEARAQAAALLAEAREEGYRAGYRDGEQQGLAEGRAKAEAEMEAAVKQTMKVLTAAVHEKARIVAGSRDDVLKIVRKVAEKIIRAEVRLDPATVERAIDASLRLVTERSRILVRVHPEDVARVREGVPHFLRYFTPSAVLEVCADPRVTPGGCVLETNAGNIDAQLETQLEEATGKLEEALYGA